VLDIPYFYLINSHNLFLDVIIEQGMFGGVAFLLLYLLCLWFVAREIARSQVLGLYLFNWLALCALTIAFIHGLVDDYLYNGKGAFLSIFPAGMAMLAVKGNSSNQVTNWRSRAQLTKRLVFAIGLTFLILVAGTNFRLYGMPI
jgi:O-antigen ligase